MKSLVIGSVFLALVLLVCGSVFAGGIDKWIDKDGVPHYTDSPGGVVRNTENLPSKAMSTLPTLPKAPEEEGGSLDGLPFGLQLVGILIS